MFCGYRSASEGVNFDKADACILFDFDIKEINTARQVYGRTLRRNNINNKVVIYPLIRCDILSFILTSINVSYAINRNLTRISKKTQLTIYDIAEDMKKQGLDIFKINDTELMYIFCTSGIFYDIDPSKLTLPLNLILRYMWL